VLAEVDVVILAAPVRQNLRLLDELDEHVRGPAVVTDTGSTKRAIVLAARRLPPGRVAAKAVDSRAPPRRRLRAASMSPRTGGTACSEKPTAPPRPAGKIGSFP